MEGDPTPLSARAPAIGEDVATLKQALAQQEVELQALRSHLQSLGRAEAEAGLGCWTFDLQAGTGWWSEEMHTLFGRDPHRGVPSNEAYLALIHPEDRALLAQTLADLAQGARRNSGIFAPTLRVARPARCAPAITSSVTRRGTPSGSLAQCSM